MRSAAGTVRRAVPNRSVLASLAGTAGLLLALAVVSRILYRLVQLDEPAYRSFSVTLAALRSPKLVVLVLAPAALTVWFRRNMRWSDMDQGRLLRILVLSAAAALLVPVAFYEPNWFLGRAHLVDRGLLVGLFALSVWRPIALVPFTIGAGIMAAQFAVPLGRATSNDKRLVMDAVILFCLAAGAGILRRRGGVGALIGAIAVLVVSWYLVAVVGKIDLAWPGREQLANFTRAAHLAGWLPGSSAGRVTELVVAVNWLLVPATIVLELAAVLVLVGRRPALALLIALPGLHAVVFLLSGTFFWKWIVLELALGLFLVRCDRAIFTSFGLPLVLLALPVAFLSPRLFDVGTLAWYDTSYTVNLNMEVVGASGTAYRVSADDLAPYDGFLAPGKLGFLAKPAMLVGSRGATLDWEVAGRIQRARSPADLAAAERQLGVSRYDEADSLIFDRFIRSRFQAWAGPPALRPPPHVWTGRPPAFLDLPATGFAGQEEVAEVRVTMHKVWWDGRRYVPLASCAIRTVPLTAPFAATYVAPETACAI